MLVSPRLLVVVDRGGDRRMFGSYTRPLREGRQVSMIVYI